jgi:hypothetical protein
MSAGEMESWRSTEALSLAEAAALIHGISPSLIKTSTHELGQVYLATADGDPRSNEFTAALRSLLAAIRLGTLKAEVLNVARYLCALSPNADLYEFEEKIDPIGTMVNVDNLRAWLVKQGMRPALFFTRPETCQPAHIKQPGYLDPTHSEYAPKIKALINAWEAVTTNPELLRGKTPKQALANWLTEHASEFGLIKDDGTPFTSVIEELAKAANWKPEGGVGKTPGH